MKDGAHSNFCARGGSKNAVYRKAYGQVHLKDVAPYRADQAWRKDADHWRTGGQDDLKDEDHRKAFGQARPPGEGRSKADGQVGSKDAVYQNISYRTRSRAEIHRKAYDPTHLKGVAPCKADQVYPWTGRDGVYRVLWGVPYRDRIWRNEVCGEELSCEHLAFLEVGLA